MIKKRSIFLMLATLFALLFCVGFANTHKANASSNRVYDLSEWQGNFTAKKVKKLKHEVPFVILRVQYGSSYRDKTFNNNRKLLEKYGLPYGVYSFSRYSSAGAAKSEAKHLYKLAPNAKFYVNDYEMASVKHGSSNNATKAWVQALRPLVGSKKILFYSYQHFMLQHAAKALKYYDGYWVAAYQSKKPSLKSVMWQYTDRHYSSALGKKIDASLLGKGKDWFIGNVELPVSNKDNSASSKSTNTLVPDSQKKSRPVKTQGSVKYYNSNLKLTVKDNANFNFYNHLGEDTTYKSRKRLHLVKDYKAATLFANKKGVTKNGDVYYRVTRHGKSMGWIKSNSVENYIDYKSANEEKTIKADVTGEFNEHVKGSHFADNKSLGNVQDLAGKKVKIIGEAKKVGWNTHYYLVQYEGKTMGWTYQSVFE
ncbi:GH25 family lysozyme [Apilactobacillus micheneri]|nr:GH25 family lysozyme [Apilactobacillus micheneri]